MFNFLKDLKLSKDVSDLISLDALLLVHVLHGVHLLCVSLLNNAYLQRERERERERGRDREREGEREREREREREGERER